MGCSLKIRRSQERRIVWPVKRNPKITVSEISAILRADDNEWWILIIKRQFANNYVDKAEELLSKLKGEFNAYKLQPPVEHCAKWVLVWGYMTSYWRNYR